MPLDTVEGLLAPITFEAFLADAWGKTYLHVPGVPDKAKGLVSWADLDALLEGHRLEPSRIRLVRAQKEEEDGELFDLSQADGTLQRIRAGSLYRHLRQGATLSIDEVEEALPGLRPLAEALDKCFGARVQANLYASWGTDTGFCTHWDDHDVFVVQLEGKKRWQVFGPTRRYPLARGLETPTPPPTEALWESLLTPGDVLYIPRGHWHDVVGIGEPTMHLTIGVDNRTGMDLIGHLTERLREVEAFRMDLPRFGDETTKREHGKRLREALVAAWSDDLVARYLTEFDAGLGPRTRIDLLKGVAAANADDGPAAQA